MTIIRYVYTIWYSMVQGPHSNSSFLIGAQVVQVSQCCFGCWCVLVLGGAFVLSALVLVGVLLNLRTTGLTTLGNCSTSSFHFLLRRSFWRALILSLPLQPLPLSSTSSTSSSSIITIYLVWTPRPYQSAALTQHQTTWKFSTIHNVIYWHHDNSHHHHHHHLHRHNNRRVMIHTITIIIIIENDHSQSFSSNYSFCHVDYIQPHHHHHHNQNQNPHPVKLIARGGSANGRSRVLPSSSDHSLHPTTPSPPSLWSPPVL